eukprot:scaffold184138_cov14-Tisochrysis_lutea.AAC.1
MSEGGCFSTAELNSPMRCSSRASTSGSDTATCRHVCAGLSIAWRRKEQGSAAQEGQLAVNVFGPHVAQGTAKNDGVQQASQDFAYLVALHLLHASKFGNSKLD